MAPCFKEILISQVQSKPILWQDTHKSFKNKSVTDKLWLEVGIACGVEGNGWFETKIWGVFQRVTLAASRCGAPGTIICCDYVVLEITFCLMYSWQRANSEHNLEFYREVCRVSVVNFVSVLM